MCDTFVIKNIENLNLHEFTTMVIYYLSHPEVCSSVLKNTLIDKIGRSVTEFNEY
jgi:hypothetical protein